MDFLTRVAFQIEFLGSRGITSMIHYSAHCSLRLFRSDGFENPSRTLNAGANGLKSWVSGKDRERSPTSTSCSGGFPFFFALIWKQCFKLFTTKRIPTPGSCDLYDLLFSSYSLPLAPFSPLQVLSDHEGPHALKISDGSRLVEANCQNGRGSVNTRAGRGTAPAVSVRVVTLGLASHLSVILNLKTTGR